MRTNGYTAHVARLRSLLFPFLCVLSLVAYGFLVSEKIDLARDDIGRHIATGRMVVERGIVPMTNFYSYTEPTRRAVNHHWGSGTLFYAAWRIAGFEGLSLFHVALRVGALILLVALAVRKAGWGGTALITLAALPLLIRRREVRPEAFTYLFLAATLWLMETWAVEKGKFRLALAATAGIAVAWANTHIQFIFGPLVIAAYLVGDVMARHGVRRRLTLLAVFVAATILTPGGLRGVLLPFLIMRAYPVPVGENQPLVLMQRLFHGPEYAWFEVLAAAVVLLVTALVVRRRRWAAWVPYAGLGIVFAAFGFVMIRNMLVFAYMLIPVAAGLVHALAGGVPGKRLQRVAGVAAFVITLAMVPVLRTPYTPVSPNPGLGLLPGVNNAAGFLTKEHIAGPIFNNYDIGGYLIYHLFPANRVFTDNRPEAYSPAFWQQLYFPMLRTESVWKSADAYYGFNAIVVSPYGLSVSDRVFIERINTDPAWALVYLDWYAAVFLKRNDTNKDIITRYEAPGRSVYDGSATR